MSGDRIALTVEALVERERQLLRERDRHARLAQRAADLRAREPRDSAPIDFGDLRRTSPISDVWGTDRGRPVDRFYIAQFLDRHRSTIGGRVLEVKDGGYTRAFGDGRVTRLDILDIDASNPNATIVADLAAADAIPGESFDCIVLTQVLGLIYDVDAAIGHVHRILKPGGTLLCTVPASGRLSYEPPGRAGDYWRFTQASVERLFGAHFPRAFFELDGFGNVLAATAFLYGMADHELTPQELAYHDPFFPIVYAIRATRRPRPAGAVLMYHRVADVALDPHHLCVSPSHFREHMDVLRSRGLRVVSLDQMTTNLNAGRLDDRTVAVTFDDGYRDALTAAAPVLRAFDYPATFFIVGATLDGAHLPWEGAAATLSADDVRALASEFEIGAHGERHVRLPDTPFEVQIAEAQQSRTRLEMLLGRPVRSFAYPFGAVDASSARALGDAGFTAAVTTTPALVTHGANMLRIPRLEIRDCDGAGFARLLDDYGLSSGSA